MTATGPILWYMNLMGFDGWAGSGLYDERLSDVYELTKRQDLVTETAIALRSATLSAHNAADGGTGNIGATAPFTWASGDQLIVSGRFPL
jgi:hypothetical protein